RRVLDARGRAERVLQRFAIRCSEAGVASVPHLDPGDPPAVLARTAERYDLVLLGLETYFRADPLGAACDTLEKVLQSPPRPVVAVPDQLGDGATVVVGYDGSLQAARTLAA